MRTVALITALLLAACSSLFDGPVPPGWAERVESARASLEQHWDGPGRPRFAFIAVRCRDDGGRLITFAQLDGRDHGTFAYAMQGPDALSDSWGGGFGLPDLADDPEIKLFFAQRAEVPCGPGPAPAT